jgi:N-acetylmannosamine-6-phosphate 2-epimerase/N-acetylmannosamine kinase
VRWTLNPSVLTIPSPFPLVEGLRRRLGVRVFALNDVQASAWGGAESGHGVCRRFDRHRARRPTADHASRATAHAGQWRCGERVKAPRPEHPPPGTGRASEVAAGHSGDVAGAEWAKELIDQAASRLAATLACLQALLDPDCIVIDGGVGARAC